MIVEGAVAAPLLWAGVPPVLVHNLLLLGAIAASGVAMFVLVRYLTGSRGAGLIAGVVFAFVPYRFEHYMHMELQWTMWMPLAFLRCTARSTTGRVRDGLADRRVHRAADAVEHLLRDLPRDAARRIGVAAPARRSASRRASLKRRCWRSRRARWRLRSAARTPSPYLRDHDRSRRRGQNERDPRRSARGRRAIWSRLPTTGCMAACSQRAAGGAPAVSRASCPRPRSASGSCCDRRRRAHRLSARARRRLRNVARVQRLRLSGLCTITCRVPRPCARRRGSVSSW